MRRIALVASLAATAASLGLLGCYKHAPGNRKAVQPVVSADTQTRAGLKTIAILTPVRAQTTQIRDVLMSDLSRDFDLVTIRTDAGISQQELGEALAAVQPACIVVMDNSSVRLYRDLQRSAPSRTFPPAVVLMTSFLDQVILTLRDATGIAYEVPAVTSFVAVREIVKKPVRRVGVVYRAVFTNLVEAQTRLAAVEKLTIVGAVVPDEPSPNAIDDALYSLLHEQHVDALWVINDNALLGHDTLRDIWLPRLRDRPLPVVVGVSTLVRPDVRFGTLAVLPDHERMGVQAAHMIFELADNDWKLKERRVELPLSVRTVADVEQLRQKYGLQPGALGKIDEALY